MARSTLRIVAQVLFWLSVTWAGTGVVAKLLQAVFPPADLAASGFTIPMIFGVPAAVGLAVAAIVLWIDRRLRARRALRRAERADRASAADRG